MKQKMCVIFNFSHFENMYLKICEILTFYCEKKNILIIIHAQIKQNIGYTLCTYRGLTVPIRPGIFLTMDPTH